MDNYKTLIINFVEDAAWESATKCNLSFLYNVHTFLALLFVLP
jgi:hypothetical protein